MSQAALTVEGLSKKFCRSLKRSLWYGIEDLASEMFLRRGGRGRLRRDEFWSLKDVNFGVAQGETLGLVGHNGAGKSTLLKLVNGLIKPDEGRIRIRGRIGALIELGAGFHPVLTGRENIFVNAAILGLSRGEVERRLGEIIDFAEIGEFIDAPVQSYSSGMKVRLGFSVAAHLNPDVLLIDEVLSVGDAAFRKRCVDRLSDYRRRGGTIIFVSHNAAVVEAMCDRVLWLDHGRVVEVGEPAGIIRKYEAQALEVSRKADLRLRARRAEDGERMTLAWAGCYDAAGRPLAECEFGETFEIRLRYEMREETRPPFFVITLSKSEWMDKAVSAMSMMWDGVRPGELPPEGEVRCLVKKPQLSPGVYRVMAGAMTQPSAELGEKWSLPLAEVGSVTVTPGPLIGRLPGLAAVHLVSQLPPALLDHAWSLDGRLLPVADAPACDMASAK